MPSNDPHQRPVSDSGGVPGDSVELVVVGCGAAGLATSLSFLETKESLGSSGQVLVIETAPKGSHGGATAHSEAWCRIDLEAGSGQLDPAWSDRMLELSQGKADVQLMELSHREAPATARFLAEHGAPLAPVSPPLASSVPHAAPAEGGRTLVEAFTRALEQRSGAEIRYETEAVRLTASEHGVIDGVVVRDATGAHRRIGANAVVLACGNTEGDPETLTHNLRAWAGNIRLLGESLAYNTGAGLRMAGAHGAERTGSPDRFHGCLVDARDTAEVWPLYGHVCGILVNRAGERFLDEGAGPIDQTYEEVAYQVWRHQNQAAVLVLDDKLMRLEVVQEHFATRIPPLEANSIEELETLLDMPAGALVSTVANFNRACGTGGIDLTRRDGNATFGLTPRKSNWATPLSEPPFRAFPVTAAIGFALGGLRIDPRGRVLSERGDPIQGLYAAGEIVGWFFNAYGPVDSVSVLNAVSLGRLIGCELARADGNAKDPSSCSGITQLN
jgi:tricarballylate dehydrogenase